MRRWQMQPMVLVVLPYSAAAPVLCGVRRPRLGGAPDATQELVDRRWKGVLARPAPQEREHGGFVGIRHHFVPQQRSYANVERVARV